MVKFDVDGILKVQDDQRGRGGSQEEATVRASFQEGLCNLWWLTGELLPWERIVFAK